MEAPFLQSDPKPGRGLTSKNWNVVYDLLVEQGLLCDRLEVQEYTGIHSWVEYLTCYTVVHSRRSRSCSLTPAPWMPQGITRC